MSYAPGEDAGSDEDQAVQVDLGAVRDMEVRDLPVVMPLDMSDAADFGSDMARQDMQITDLGAFDMSDMSVDMPPASGLVPAILAHGQADRLMISCDDGRTWRHDRALGTQYECFEDYTLCTEGDPLDCDCQAEPALCAPETFFDCNHSKYSSTGLLQAGDWIFETRGWGHAGGVRRSKNAVDWEELWPDFSSSGLVHVDGVLLSGGYWTKRSTDDGETWGERTLTTFMSNNNVRAHGVGTYQGQPLVVFVGNKGTLTLSSDAGETWWAPDTYPAECGDGVRGTAFLDDVIYVADSKGQVCTSLDGGHVWSLNQVTDSFQSAMLVHEGKVKLWNKGEMWSSADGITWESTPIMPASAQPGAVTISNEGALISVNNAWRQWYDMQEFYRSTDGGLTWEVLDGNVVTGGHPIRFLLATHVEPHPMGCPAP